MATITITIEGGGNIESEISGITGKGCDGIDKFLYDAQDVVRVTKKPEYFKKENQTKAKQKQKENQ